MEDSETFSFWAQRVSPEKVLSITSGSNEDCINLTMACFGEDLKEKSRTVVNLECNNRKSPICVLTSGVHENQLLNLNLPGGVEFKFTLTGSNPSAVNLSGFLQPLLSAEEFGKSLEEAEAKVGTKRSLEETGEEVDEPPRKKIKEVQPEPKEESSDNEDNKVEVSIPQTQAETMQTETAEEEKIEAAEDEKTETVEAEQAQNVKLEEASAMPENKEENALEEPKTNSPKKKKKKKKKNKKLTMLEGGVGYRVLKPGVGPSIKKGKTVRLRYIGQLKVGKTIFDKNLSDGFTFTVGKGDVIKGWDLGVVGMMLNEKRKLSIPAAMAYGKVGSDDIPPNSDLLFTVELMEIM